MLSPISIEKKEKIKMKTIKLTNYEINGIVSALKDSNSLLYTNDPTKRLPVPVLWVMDENFETLSKIASRIQKKREEIEREYIDDEHSYDDFDPNGNPIRKIKEQYFNEFNKRLIELMNIENEVEIRPISVDQIKDFSLVPVDYRSIRFMLDNPEDEKDKNVTEN